MRIWILFSFLGSIHFAIGASEKTDANSTSSGNGAVYSLGSNSGFGTGNVTIETVDSNGNVETETLRKDRRKSDEIKCPQVNSPDSFGFIFHEDGRTLTGTAKLRNNQIVEFGWISTSKSFMERSYASGGSNTSNTYREAANGQVDSNTVVKNENPPPPKPRNSLSPSAGSQIGKLETVTLTAFLETDPKSNYFGKVKAYQYRQGNNPNVFYDLIGAINSKTPDSQNSDVDNSNQIRATDFTPLVNKIEAKIKKYAACCPNESVFACDKQWKKKERDQIEAAEASRPPPPKPSGFKDVSPFSTPK